MQVSDVLIIFGCCAFLGVCISVFGIQPLVFYFRKKRHPLYFEYLDAGMGILSDSKKRFNKEAERFRHEVSQLESSDRNGCTNEYFRRKLNRLADRYLRAKEIYYKDREQADQYLRAADAYAVDHNIKWGVIFDGKQE